MDIINNINNNASEDLGGKKEPLYVGGNVN
jgi:hypothetical protein